MTSLREEPFSMCPLRSPVLPPEEMTAKSVLSSLGNDQAAFSAPREIYGPCLGAGCGMYVPTKVENNRILQGVCGIRGMAVGMDVIGKALTQLLTIAKKFDTSGETQKS